MARRDHPKLSQDARWLFGEVKQWVRSFPPHEVDVTPTVLPPGDDYGAELTIEFRPARPRACPLLIGVLPEGAFRFYLMIGDLALIAAAEDTPLSCVIPASVPLFLEPTFDLSAQEAFEVCQAVARGDVMLTIGVLFRRIVATTGRVNTPSRVLCMHGTGLPLCLAKLGSRLRVGEIKRFVFDSWY